MAAAIAAEDAHAAGLDLVAVTRERQRRLAQWLAALDNLRELDPRRARELERTIDQRLAELCA